MTQHDVCIPSQQSTLQISTVAYTMISCAFGGHPRQGHTPSTMPKLIVSCKGIRIRGCVCDLSFPAVRGIFWRGCTGGCDSLLVACSCGSFAMICLGCFCGCPARPSLWAGLQGPLPPCVPAGRALQDTPSKNTKWETHKHSLEQQGLPGNKHRQSRHTFSELPKQQTK